LRPHQSEIAELDAKTRLFRVFESTVIPGLLQTAEYARARFAQGIAMFKVRNDDEWTDTVRLMQNPNYSQSGVSQGSFSRKLATRRVK
jgi:predicted transcriptional regulator